MNDKNKPQIYKLNKVVPLYNLFFGIIVVMGGLMGYFKAGSLPSLSAGLFFGNLLMLTIWGTDFFASSEKDIEKKESPRVWGYYLSTVLSVALLGFFITRIINTGKLMPAVIIITFGVFAILGNLYILHKNSINKNE
ncbi:MAG: TMEM14 family protein [Candidatus Caenarcaniphilales bacterium]|nr:TMEM14 family protein [Candidatus Caenarcaniphilales bacterium]